MGSLSTSNASVAFDKMEEKVMAMEAEAESTALLVGSDKIEDKFALLEAGSGTREQGGEGELRGGRRGKDVWRRR